MPENSNSTPILTPVISLLHSRKFIVAVLTALVDTLVLAVPSLAAVHVELLAVITTLGLAFIGTTAWEDAAEKGAPVIETQNVTVTPAPTGTTSLENG